MRYIRSHMKSDSISEQKFYPNYLTLEVSVSEQGSRYPNYFPFCSDTETPVLFGYRDPWLCSDTETPVICVIFSLDLPSIQYLWRNPIFMNLFQYMNFFSWNMSVDSYNIFIEFIFMSNVARLMKKVYRIHFYESS